MDDPTHAYDFAVECSTDDVITFGGVVPNKQAAPVLDVGAIYDGLSVYDTVYGQGHGKGWRSGAYGCPR